MPATTHSLTLDVPPDQVWNFVHDMDHWAPFLLGYQSHDKISDRESKWTLKGDLGVLSRVVELSVHITEWLDNEKVSFSLEGINEQVTGTGSFTLVSVDGAEEVVPAPPPPWYRAIIDWLMGLVGMAPQRQAIVSHAPASELAFYITLNAGGPMGPMVNAMLGPWLQAFAEDLASKIGKAVSTS
jgi:carbon monoxide dehydrogenase subunit G